MKQKIKNIIDALIMAPMLAIGAIVCVEGVITFNIPLALISFPVMVISADRLKGDIEGNFINKSIFSVSKKGKITQDTLRHPLKFIKILGNKNKKEILIKEEFNMFKQLKRCDSKGNIINYNTISQGLTVKLLRNLEKLGYIENLECTFCKKSNLFFEKLLIGNKSKSKNKKKMFNITFNVTDEKIDDGVFFKLINPNNSVEESTTEQQQNNQKYDESRQVIKDNSDNSDSLYNPTMELQRENEDESKTSIEKITTKEEQIKELIKLKESLLDNEDNKEDTNNRTL